MKDPTVQETTVELNGATYTLVLDLNAQCLFEQETGKNFYEVASDTGYIATAKENRIMLWAMLQKHHPDLTIEQAGALVTTLEQARAKVTEQIKLSQPEPEEGASAEAGSEIPPEPTG